MSKTNQTCDDTGFVIQFLVISLTTKEYYCSKNGSKSVAFPLSKKEQEMSKVSPLPAVDYDNDEQVVCE